MTKTIGVIGLGNPLRGDDGVGIAIIEHLQKHKAEFPTNIAFIDGGTSGMNLLHLLAGFNVVLIIDAVDFKASAGASRFFSLEEIQDQKMPIGLSTHEPDFLSIIRVSKKLHQLPDHLVFFGIQPKSVSFKVGLSPELTKRMPYFIERTQKKIRVLSR